MIIDCQSHVFPRAYAELLRRNRNSLRTTRVDDGAYLINYGDVQRFRIDLDSYSAERKLRAMDAAGLDMSVISVNIPSPDMLDPDLASEGARVCNEAVAELCAGHPDRFLGLASLPLNDVPAAIAELDRAIDELDLRGVFTPSHVNGAPLDASQFEAFYAHVAGRGVPLVLHPTVPVWGGAVKEHSMIPMMGFMVDTSFAMLRLILGGVMERFPTLQVVHPHVGGVLPYLMGRVVEQTEVKRRGRDHITASPRETYKRVYLDLVSPDPLAIRYAYDFAGADRLLFGSDHPWVSIDAILELVQALDIPAADKDKLLAGNARELFRIA
ncbi:MAG: amidohydrolase family protein [Chloroflexota bacterium]|nr:amidohydrolase family protein [Chloroflexota bacterium]